MRTLSWALVIMLIATGGLWFLLDRYLASQIARNVDEDHPWNLAVASKRDDLTLTALCVLMVLAGLAMLTSAYSRMFGYDLTL